MSGENKNQNTMRNRQGRRGPGGPGGPGSHFGAPVEKAKNFRGSLARLLRYLKPHKVHLIVVLIFAIASTSFTIAAPKVSSKAINKLQDAYMARMMLQKMSEAQEKGVDSIYTQMADAQLKAVDQINQQMADAGTSKQISPESLDTIKALVMLPAINTLQDPQEKANTVIKMLALFNALPNMGGNSTDNTTQNGTVKKIDAESISTIKTFLQLPMLSSVTNAEEKADVCQKIIDLGEKMSATSATGLDMPNTQQNVEFTDDQINGAITAIRETNGEYDFHYIGMIALILIGMYLISALFSLIMGLVMSGVSQRTVRDLRRVVDNKLAKLPLKYYDMHPYGDILSRVTNDIDTIATTLQQSLTQIITSVITIIGYIIMMLTISPVLTLIIIASLPLYMLSTTMIAKKSQKYFAVQQKELGDLSSHVEEMYTGHKIVKAFGHEKDAIEKFESINNRLYGAGWKAQFVSGIMFPLMNFISNLSYVGISIVGGIWITRNLLGLGDILAFIQYSRSFTMPIIQTANIANVIQSTIACAERVFEVLDEQEEIPDSPEAVILDMPKGNIRIDHVSFRYTEDVPLIEDMNLEVRQGDTIAIVGPTGAGKTTLVNLLMRFYEISSGKISIDGVDIKDMPRSELRKLFGMVLQDTWLFNGSIKDNITYSKEGATMEQIVRAAKAAHADHFIRTLPDGYDTILNEEATNISQGQKQLLTIARAILADPAILILDEATSSVDTRTEVLIQKAMKNLMKGRTNFVIAHRLSTIRDAELILVMNNGSIIETGNHKELLAKGGFYAELYNSQFSEDTDIAG
ncbi:MAG: ABC transporter ATP-binding protein [Candidatus Dehalobacter alkaniphilus]